MLSIDGKHFEFAFCRRLLLSVTEALFKWTAMDLEISSKVLFSTDYSMFFNAKAGSEVFSEVGWKLVQEVPSIKDILKRNTKGGKEYDEKKPEITMTDPSYNIGLAGIT